MTATSPPLLNPLRLALAVSLASLGIAYAAQWGLGLTPCHLCLIQRIPFALTAVISLIGLLKIRWRRGALAIICAALAMNTCVASYHMAVEKHWVPGPASCTSGDTPASLSDEDFLKRIQSAPIVACDQPQWEFHGVTMAGLNAIWCLFLTLAFFAVLVKAGRRHA